MTCQRCKSRRVAKINGKTSDMCSVTVGDKSRHDYAPYDMNVGGGDYLKFSLCLDCGQLQGSFPVQPTAVEEGREE